MFVFKAAVVGAGTMGAEIAHAIAGANIPVVVKDAEPSRVESGLERARALWQRRVDAGKMQSSELDRSMALITGATDYEAFGDVDLVIEAVPEEIETKRTVFAELDQATPGHAIFASNASTLSITEMGEATSRPDKVVGLHFFYPASRARVVEVIEGADTSPETTQAASNFAQAIRKMPIRALDSPGFVVGRIISSVASELWRCEEDSGIDVHELETIIAASKATQASPIFGADLLGPETLSRLTAHLRECYGDRFYVGKGLHEDRS